MAVFWRNKKNQFSDMNAVGECVYRSSGLLFLLRSGDETQTDRHEDKRANIRPLSRGFENNDKNNQ